MIKDVPLTGIFVNDQEAALEFYTNKLGLEKARDVGDWQNYGYAVQWWLFAGFAVFLWIKMMLDELDPARVEARDADARAPQQVVPERTQPQAPAPADEDDDELAAYNRHLARLAEKGRG